jgi:hypothetical protein
MLSLTHTMQGLFFAAGLACAGIASADEGPGVVYAEAPAQAPAPAAAQGDEEILAADALESMDGGTGVDISVITQQTLTAINTGNVVTGYNVGSGGIEIGANAFSGFDGVGNFVFNTGHNNNLQSSMNVSIALAP